MGNPRAMVHPLRLLRWLYVGRLTLATGIFLGALFVWREAEATDITLWATLALLSSVVATSLSLWYTTGLQRVPGKNFLYGQVLFDTLLVTAVVYITIEGRMGSVFAPLYILVIAAGALLLPLSGGMLIGVLASILYFSVSLVDQSQGCDGGLLVVTLQGALFAVMALVTGALGDRLRHTGTALGVVES